MAPVGQRLDEVGAQVQYVAERGDLDHRDQPDLGKQRAQQLAAAWVAGSSAFDAQEHPRVVVHGFDHA